MENPECKTNLGQSILAGDRFMDDMLRSHDNKELLTEVLDDIVQTLENHWFLIKRIISNKLRYHQEKGLLSDPDTSTDGLFTAEELEETTFHHTFN